jgi:hypothetical protein
MKKSVIALICALAMACFGCGGSGVTANSNSFGDPGGDSGVPGQAKGQATFGGLKNLEFINGGNGGFYHGGTGSLGSGPGPDLGIEFSNNAQAIISGANGGSGNFTNNPGNYPVMFSQSGDVILDATQSTDGGILTALWFYYSALQPATATVYDGANGTGNILASITLNVNNSSCNTYKLCVWTPVAVPLISNTGSAKAESIRFSGVPDYLAIATIHMGESLSTTTTVEVTTSQNTPPPPCDVITATVSTLGVVPSGTVTFKANGAPIPGYEQPIDLVNGSASIPYTLGSGSPQITAAFTGAMYQGASSFKTSKGFVTPTCP